MVMNKLQFWLLKHLIRKMLYYRCSQRLFDIIWEQGKSLYYEDNAYTRYDLYMEKLRVCYRTEIQQLKRRS